jgi:single-strand selective monofunctional uracil DNA glycosylase
VSLLRVSRETARRAAAIRFGAPVGWVYNPVDYACEPHEAYLRRFGKKRGRVLLMGMNPGPWGMVQTGVPFGDVGMVRDWIGITGRVRRPAEEHPRVPVLGFDCHRREGSGRRFWGWASERGSADEFFARFFVWNYAPLCFLSESGANLTPEKLRPADRDALCQVCNRGLAEVIALLAPSAVVGVGNFAERRLREVVGDALPVRKLLHPSPANPRANAGWTEEADRVLMAL